MHFTCVCVKSKTEIAKQKGEWYKIFFVFLEEEVASRDLEEGEDLRDDEEKTEEEQVR